METPPNKVFIDVTPPDHPNVIALPPPMYGGALLLGFIFHLGMPLPMLPDALGSVIGICFCLTGLGITSIATHQFKNAGTNVRPNKPTKRIVTDGIFSATRNPIYIGLTLIYVGMSFVMGSVWPVIFLVPLLFLMQVGVVEREEAYLERKFGQEYLDYKARVRRWL